MLRSYSQCHDEFCKNHEKKTAELQKLREMVGMLQVDDVRWHTRKFEDSPAHLLALDRLCEAGDGREFENPEFEQSVRRQSCANHVVQSGLVGLTEHDVNLVHVFLFGGVFY